MGEKHKPVVLATFKNGTRLDETNYADAAERVIKKLAEDKGRDGKPTFGGLTTSKLRSIYALIMNVYTRVNTQADFEEHVADIQYLKVKMAYEAGREKSVKQFLTSSSLRALISYVKDYDQFVLYCRYAESLVAYFKYYGGKD